MSKRINPTTGSTAISRSRNSLTTATASKKRKSIKQRVNESISTQAWQPSPEATTIPWQRKQKQRVNESIHTTGWTAISQKKTSINNNISKNNNKTIKILNQTTTTTIIYLQGWRKQTITTHTRNVRLTTTNLKITFHQTNGITYRLATASKNNNNNNN
jgi:hypothetical protein